MKKIGYGLILIGVLIIIFGWINKGSLEKEAKQNIEYYIEDTSIQKNDMEKTTDVKQETIDSSNDIKYTAVIEIPSINLKQGVVDSTRNFSSINYAVSVDENSRYPNQNGNFILYSHSGNSNIAFFYRLHEVEINDNIYVFYNGTKYHYIVYDKYNIEKTGKAKIETSDFYKYITLITCNQSQKGKQIVIIGKLFSELSY